MNFWLENQGDFSPSLCLHLCICYTAPKDHFHQLFLPYSHQSVITPLPIKLYSVHLGYLGGKLWYFLECPVYENMWVVSFYLVGLLVLGNFVTALKNYHICVAQRMIWQIGHMTIKVGNRSTSFYCFFCYVGDVENDWLASGD